MDHKTRLKRRKSNYWAPLHDEKAVDEELEGDRLELEEYDSEMKRAYWFPYQCKYIAWGISLATIFSCTVVLILYGMTFGEIKSKLWLSTVFSSMALSTFLVQPAKVLLVAAVSSYIFKWERPVVHKPLSRDLFHNPPDKEKLAQVREMRREMAACYSPPDPSTMRKRKIQIRNIIEMESLALDVASYIIFMVTMYVLVFSNRSEASFYNNMTIKQMVVDGSFTKTIPLTRVISYEQFIEYLNETLIPVLLQNESSWRKEMSGVQQEDEPIPMIDRGFTRDPHLKLLGRPRIRQKRVRPSSCFVHAAGAPTRQHDCVDELSPWNEDTDDYGLAWLRVDPDEPLSSGPDRIPWCYTSAWDNKAMPYYGRLRSLSMAGGGGYYLLLGKTVDNARTVLRFMDFFNWIDGRTRIIYIDFTTYSVGANLFNVVTLIIEISATGVFIPSFKIITTQFLYLQIQILLTSIVMFVAFTLFIIMFALREGVKMRRASIKAYFTEGWTWIDLLIVICGLISVLSVILRTYYVSFLLQQLDMASANEFVSFQIAASWDQTTDYFNAFLICLATVKAFRLLTFRVIFQQWDQILRDAWRPLLGLYTIVLSCVFAFSAYFHVLLGKYDERFTTMWSAFPTLLAHTTRRFDDDFDAGFLFHVPPYFGAFFYAAFLGYSSYLMVGIFATVLAVHLKAIHMQPVRSHYHIITYIKSLVNAETEVPAPPVAPLPQPVSLLRRRGCDLVPPPWIDEVRLQGLKREALQLITGKDYAEEIALNVTYIVLSGNIGRPGTDRYNIVPTDGKNILVPEAKVKQMKEVADVVVDERSNILKEQLKVKL